MRAGMAPGAPGTEFDLCLNHQPADIEVVKQRYSAFFGTSLDQILRHRAIQSVVVLGLTTNVCVQSTARDAWQCDYETITLSDCCAEIGDGSHEASLMFTSRNFGRVTTSEVLALGWRERSERKPHRDVHGQVSVLSYLRSKRIALMSVAPIFSTRCVQGSCFMTCPSGMSSSTGSPPGR